ncbi:MAG: hypothetical protein ACHQF2_06235 [Flavobacteriales bacterium]
MKSPLFILVSLLLLSACQLEKKREDGISTSLTKRGSLEVTLVSKLVEDIKPAWKLSLKDDRLYYSFNFSADSALQYVQMNEQELQNVTTLLAKCKAHKIKTKAAAGKKRKEWLTVYITNHNYTVQCAESKNFCFTKKSQKKIGKIYSYLVNLVKSKDGALTGNVSLRALVKK